MQFTKWCFTLCFYNFVKKKGKSKNEDDTFMWKKKEKQNRATKRISVDGLGIAFPVKLKITRGIA